MIWANVKKFGQNFLLPPKFFWTGAAMFPILIICINVTEKGVFSLEKIRQNVLNCLSVLKVK